MTVHLTEAVSEAEVSFVVIRANGDVEDLGTYYYSPSRWKRFMYKLRGWRS